MALPHLPDSLWLKILGYLSHDDLVLNCAEIFPRLIGDWSLWLDVNWRGGASKPSVLRKIVKHLGPHTKTLNFCGGPKNNLIIKDTLMRSVRLRCTRLQQVRMYKCQINYYDRTFRNLPRTVRSIILEELMIENYPTISTQSNSLFYKIHHHLPHLSSVMLIKCKTWYNRGVSAGLEGCPPMTFDVVN